MTLALLAAVAVGLVLGGLAVLLSSRALKARSDEDAARQKEELKGQFAALSSEALGAATDQFLKLAASRLDTERARASGELEEKRKAVESTVAQLQERLKSYEKLVRDFETDRERKYGSLEERLREAAETTGRLQSVTERLQSALSNPRARGQWGERMAEDILRASGLVENLQYLKNRAQDTVSTRPDFTFFLPDGHKVHMDVKFPLDNYLRMGQASGEEEAARFRDAFLKDARARIKEIQKRDYVNPDEKTLNFVILFIPNERVYGTMLEAAPELVDEALAQKVVLTSPFSLYAVLAVIRQSFDNFHFSQQTQEIVKLVSAFSQTYAKFKERFERLGEQLERASALYAEVSGASYKRLDQAVSRIEALRQGGEKDETPLPMGEEGR